MISELFNIANNEYGLHLIDDKVFEVSSSYISLLNKTSFLWHIVLFVLFSTNSPSRGITINAFLGSPNFIISVSFSKYLKCMKWNISSKNDKFNFFKFILLLKADLIKDKAKITL